MLSISSSLNGGGLDRKSTRLNSSHTIISYAVFCLKKKQHAQSQALARAHAGRGRVARDAGQPRASGRAPLGLCVPVLVFFFLMIRRPPRSTLFPYTTSSDLGGGRLINIKWPSRSTTRPAPASASALPRGA